MMKMIAPAIFYSPYQDDVTLTYGVDIIKHLRAGRRVIIVLYTDGQGSFVQDCLNGVSSSNYWGGTHNPSLEGYSLLSNADFANARTKEYLSEGPQLGVNPSDVIVDFADTVDKAGLKTLIRKYEVLYPGFSHKVMSYYDTAMLLLRLLLQPMQN
jgi:hypothetical protein